MNSISCTTFTAQVTLGLYKGYSKAFIPLEAVKEALTLAQRKIQLELGIALSAKVTPCDIVFLGQDEPSVTLQFIQYPKFIQEVALLKNAIIALTKMMLLQMEQNRVVIVFTDETIMLEQSDAIDPAITF